MKNKVNTKSRAKKLWLIIAAIAALLVVALAIVFLSTIKNEEYPSLNGSELDVQKFSPVQVYEGLQITSMGDYAGLFFEDGTDEVVSSVMMLELENTSEMDLQLARIKAEYPGFTAEFEATNIPAGESVVLLEKNRHKPVKEDCVGYKAENVEFFQSNMTIMEDTFSVTAGDGFVELKNISSEDIQGVTYVYYKNIAGETLYGGITYRATITDEIPAGESVRVLTNHFTRENTKIMQIVNVE